MACNKFFFVQKLKLKLLVLYIFHTIKSHRIIYKISSMWYKSFYKYKIIQKIKIKFSSMLITKQIYDHHSFALTKHKK